MSAERIIGSRRVYTGTAHPWARGLTVEIRAVHRGEKILEADHDVGALRPGDLIEFAPWIEREQRFSWVTSDAAPEDLALP